MAEVVLTLKDIDDGDVHIHLESNPPLGEVKTPAQAMAVILLNRAVEEAKAVDEAYVE